MKNHEIAIITLYKREIAGCLFRSTKVSSLEKILYACLMQPAYHNMMVIQITNNIDKKCITVVRIWGITNIFFTRYLGTY